MAEGRRRVFVSMASLRKAGLRQEGRKSSREVAACASVYVSGHGGYVYVC